MTVRMTPYMLLASLIALASATQAQVEFDLGVIVVGTGFEGETLDDTGVSVDVITESDLAATGETRVIDYLARQPGVTLRSTGTAGGNGSVFIRGVSQNNVAVRVDGIDVSDPSGPQVAFDFGGLMTSDIRQIEIIRGSQSAIYGSEAIGGVINITTKRATKDGLSASGSVEFGSFGTQRGALTLTNKGAGHETAVTLTYAKTDGISAADDDAPDFGTLNATDRNDETDGFESRRLSFSGSYDIGAATLSLSGFAENSRYDYDEAASGQVYDGSPDDVTDKKTRGLRAALDFTTGAVDHTLSASMFTTERVLTGTAVDRFGSVDPVYVGIAYPFRYAYDGTRQTLGYQIGFDIDTAARAALGVERTSEGYADDIYLISGFGPFSSDQKHDTQVNSIYGEISVSPSEDVDLSLALRSDNHSQFGQFTTWRVSGVWRARPNLTLRANAANGYRAPSNYELYAPSAGNAALRPETSTSLDLGVEKTFGEDAYLRATLFWVEAEDIIDYSYSTSSYVQAPGKATRRGLELAFGAAITDRVRLDGSYTLTESFGDAALDTASWALSVPRHSLSASLAADLTDRAALTVTGLFEADRAGGLPDYGVVNTTFSYDVTENLGAYLRVENLFDADYQTVPGYGQPGRGVFFGINASF